jgi:transcriptional regulator with XRE-family HTH domain
MVMPIATLVLPDGARLRELRLARNLSQKALARELALTVKWVSTTERGLPVSRAAVLHLALFFGVTEQDITAKPAETSLADAA